VASCFEDDNEAPGCMNRGEFNDYVSYY